MEQIDRNRILDHYKDINEFIENVGEYEINIQDCPVTLKIKVKKFAPETYYGVANYAIKTPEQVSSYRSMHYRKSAQEALEDALGGFMCYWDPKLKDEIEFILDGDW